MKLLKLSPYDEESLHMGTTIESRWLIWTISKSVKLLKAAEVDTLGDLVSFNKTT
jgi:DNA-directed RNA polymerase subunit alpha